MEATWQSARLRKAAPPLESMAIKQTTVFQKAVPFICTDFLFLHAGPAFLAVMGPVIFCVEYHY
jgi:hypothetical protein